MKSLVIFVLLLATFAYSQVAPNSSTISVAGDAAINVAPDRVRINFGVQTRNKILDAATNANDVSVRRVIAAVRGFQVTEGDIQTEDIRVSMGYNDHDNTLVDYYEVTKGVKYICVTYQNLSRCLWLFCMLGPTKFTTSNSAHRNCANIVMKRAPWQLKQPLKRQEI